MHVDTTATTVRFACLGTDELYKYLTITFDHKVSPYKLSEVEVTSLNIKKVLEPKFWDGGELRVFYTRGVPGK